LFHLIDEQADILCCFVFGPFKKNHWHFCCSQLTCCKKFIVSCLCQHVVLQLCSYLSIRSKYYTSWNQHNWFLL